VSVGAITAGEASVSITCDNAELVAGLRESSATIQATARSVAAAEDALTANVGVEEWERTAFLATYAANANPCRKCRLDVKIRSAPERRTPPSNASTSPTFRSINVQKSRRILR
jgi:hypothetical protein